MKKLQSRAIICLFFAAILILGTGFYIFKFVKDGKQWISFPSNKHIYQNGKLSTGTIKDRSGRVIVSNTKNGETKYIDNVGIRNSLVHTIGDSQGNVVTGANRIFRDRLVGYNLITGTFASSGEGRTLTLTVDGEVSAAARAALGNRTGTVGVYNYKTGEIICMVSSPNYDPANPPKLKDKDSSGTFINRLTSSKVVPGSIMKLVTSMAAIEKLPNINSYSYTCTGSHQYGRYKNDKVTDLAAHGRQNFAGALANSCNCAFGDISNKLGKSTLEEYVKKSGLMNSYDIDGIKTKPSSFEFDSNQLNLAWTGIGQSKDLVNPLAMMVFVGSIANGGQTKTPYLLSDVSSLKGNPLSYSPNPKEVNIMSSDTANKLKALMKNNVNKTYKNSSFPNLDVYGKSGTAEHKKGATPHSWFTGFISDPDHPYAFIVLVENGGYGNTAATKVANQVLQKAVKLNK